ncbi:hypothetical protein DFS34DRAFT_243151 [Phlyctochytrium arcticum]|nr:hypothetical protein DFS34DRAFT_243151 [Phlyctochytrium arcticum]
MSEPTESGSAELMGFGDSDMTSDDLRSPRRAQSFRKPRIPSKKRSFRRRINMRQSEGESDRAASLSPSPASTPPNTDVPHQGDSEHEAGNRETSELVADDDLLTALHTATDEVEMWRKKYRDLEDETTRLRDHQDQQDLACQQLQEEVQLLRRQQSQTERERDSLKRELENASTVIASLRQKIDDGEEQSSAQISHLTSMNSGLKEELAHSDDLVHKAQEELNEAKKAHDMEKHAHIVIIRTLEEEIRTRPASTLRNRASVASLNDVMRSGSLEDQLQQLVEQNLALQEEIEMLRNAEELSPISHLPSLSLSQIPDVSSPPLSPPADDVPVKPESINKGPRIPRRTSSVRELLLTKVAKAGLSLDTSAKDRRISVLSIANRPMSVVTGGIGDIEGTKAVFSELERK